MKRDRIEIDQEKFAYNFINTIDFDKTNDIEKAAKERLIAYLSAYYLIEKFNEVEGKDFNKLDIFKLSYTEFLNIVNKNINSLK